jgi:hypothetical protein
LRWKRDAQLARDDGCFEMMMMMMTMKRRRRTTTTTMTKRTLHGLL